jgi:hypothetical protein
LDTIRKNGLPETRETYIDLAYDPKDIGEWTAEHELGLPEHLRDPSKVSPATG